MKQADFTSDGVAMRKGAEGSGEDTGSFLNCGSEVRILSGSPALSHNSRIHFFLADRTLTGRQRWFADFALTSVRTDRRQR